MDVMIPHSHGSSLKLLPFNSSLVRAVKDAQNSHGCGGFGSKNDILLSERSSDVKLTRFLIEHPNPYEWMVLLLIFKSRRQVKKQRLGLMSSTKLNDRSSFSRAANVKTTLGIIDRLLLEASRLLSFILGTCEDMQQLFAKIIQAYRVEKSSGIVDMLVLEIINDFSSASISIDFGSLLMLFFEISK
jgi:hypothetical protein